MHARMHARSRRVSRHAGSGWSRPLVLERRRARVRAAPSLKADAPAFAGTRHSPHDAAQQHRSQRRTKGRPHPRPAAPAILACSPAENTTPPLTPTAAASDRHLGAKTRQKSTKIGLERGSSFCAGIMPWQPSTCGVPVKRRGRNPHSCYAPQQPATAAVPSAPARMSSPASGAANQHGRVAASAPRRARHPLTLSPPGTRAGPPPARRGRTAAPPRRGPRGPPPPPPPRDPHLRLGDEEGGGRGTKAGKGKGRGEG